TRSCHSRGTSAQRCYHESDSRRRSIQALGDGIEEVLSAYLAEDRRVALTGRASVPELAHGSMLFADVSGFTSLTSRLVRLLGPRRGAEEVPRYLNQLYDALIAEAEQRGGSVIGFAGDAISCWFARDDGTVAADCALAMQRAMAPFKEVALDDGGLELASLTLKVSVTAGPVRRYVVGDPKVQLVDVVAGDTVSRLEPLNNLAQPGEVVVDELTAVRLDRLAFGARVVERTVTTSTGAGAF